MPPMPPALRGAGRGRLDAVPGTPPLDCEPVDSSDFWVVSMTLFSGSYNSSLCSPLEKSQSTDIPTRNLPAPSNGSRVELTLTLRSRSSLRRYSIDQSDAYS